LTVKLGQTLASICGCPRDPHESLLFDLMFTFSLLAHLDGGVERLLGSLDLGLQLQLFPPDPFGLTPQLLGIPARTGRLVLRRRQRGGSFRGESARRIEFLLQ